MSLEKCALEQDPAEIIKCILNGIWYECDMCNSIVKCLTWAGSGGNTWNMAHSRKFGNKNVTKMCEYLKLKDELIRDGLIRRKD
jgi:hypothetical protein